VLCCGLGASCYMCFLNQAPGVGLVLLVGVGSENLSLSTVQAGGCSSRQPTWEREVIYPCPHRRPCAHREVAGTGHLVLQVAHFLSKVGVHFPPLCCRPPVLQGCISPFALKGAHFPLCAAGGTFSQWWRTFKGCATWGCYSSVPQKSSRIKTR
jgi:hypothetical protein